MTDQPIGLELLATKSDLAALETRIEDRFRSLEERIDDRLRSLDERIERLTMRFVGWMVISNTGLVGAVSLVLSIARA